MNRAYDALPRLLKNGIVSAYSFKSNLRKYGSEFKAHYDFLCNSDADEKAEYAAERLQAFLDRQRKSSTVYRIAPGAQLCELPIITKNELLDNYQKLVTGKSYATNKSSGTTGQPLKVHYNKEVYQHEYAYLWYHRSYKGIVRGDKVATLAGHKVTYIDRKSPPYWAYNYNEHQLIMSSYHMSPDSLGDYIRELVRFRPRVIHGYPSSVYLVAKHILDNAVRLDFRPRMVVTSSETLLDFQSTVIESAFQCKPFVWYGNTELCGHVTECERGKLHTQPTHSILRVVDEDGRDVAPGAEGTIVATNFKNECMPLINYSTRDRATTSTEQVCECGRGGLVLKSIVGRVEDYVITKDGRRIGRLDHLFKDAKFINNAQIVQVEPGEVILQIDRASQYTSKVEETVRAEAHRRLGKETEVLFDYDTPIEKDKNGKFRFIVQRYRP